MNKIVKNALILAAITLIAGLLLGAAHQVTLEPIQKQQEKEKQESCQNVFPEAVSFEEVTMSDAEQAELTAALIGHGFEAQTIDELLLAKDASGATIGLVEIKAPEVILRNEKRMLQEAVDSLFVILFLYITETDGYTVIQKPSQRSRDLH